MSDWYDASDVPVKRALLASATLRTEFGLIETAMAKLPTLTGAGDQVVVVNAGGTGLTSEGPLSVAKGGTGAATLTDGGLLLGSGTGAITAMGVLAAGEVVIGDGTTDPATLAAFTSASGQLKHEYGGLEANISAIADGDFIVGTGAGTLGLESGATARASLGVAIGSDVQAHGDVLDDLNTLGAATSDGQIIVATGAGAFAYESGATARASLGLAIGTDVQAYDAELAALAGLTSAANKLPYFTGSGTASLADLTSFGRSLIDDADASAGRSTLGLGNISTRTLTISTSAPSGGSNGDIWFVREA